MSKTFQLDIITPSKVISMGQVEYLRAPATEGLFGVQAGHAPATITMGIGEIKVTRDGKELFYTRCSEELATNWIVNYSLV